MCSTNKIRLDLVFWLLTPSFSSHPWREAATLRRAWRSTQRRYPCKRSVWGEAVRWTGHGTGPTCTRDRSGSWRPTCGWSGRRRPPQPCKKKKTDGAVRRSGGYGNQEFENAERLRHLSFSVRIWSGLSWLLLLPVPSCPYVFAPQA